MRSIAILILAALVGGALSTPQQSGPMKLQVGNDQVRVWRLTKLPHKPSPSHYTPPCVLIFLDHTRMRWTLSGKSPIEEEFASGAVKWWPGGIHVSENVGDSPIDMLIVVPLSAVPENAASEIIALEARRRQSLLKGDSESRNSILADDFREITGNGHVRTKDQNLQDTATGRVKWDVATASEEEVRFFGEVAVYTARGHNKGSIDGKSFDREVRFTRVYARREGRWQCVVAQYTPIVD